MRLHPRPLARLILALLLLLPSHTAAMEILELTGGSITFNDAQLPFLGTMAVHGPRVAITGLVQAILGSGEPPATILLLATSLTGLGVAGWRRRFHRQ